VSQSTVKFYVSNILAKLHVAGRVEAVALAVERHLIARS
jgi:DNA-binding NarL/FixJ family response regulator